MSVPSLYSAWRMRSRRPSGSRLRKVQRARDGVRTSQVAGSCIASSSAATAAAYRGPWASSGSLASPSGAASGAASCEVGSFAVFAPWSCACIVAGISNPVASAISAHAARTERMRVALSVASSIGYSRMSR